MPSNRVKLLIEELLDDVAGVVGAFCATVIELNAKQAKAAGSSRNRDVLFTFFPCMMMLERLMAPSSIYRPRVAVCCFTESPNP